MRQGVACRLRSTAALPDPYPNFTFAAHIRLARRLVANWQALPERESSFDGAKMEGAIPQPHHLVGQWQRQAWAPRNPGNGIT